MVGFKILGKPSYRKHELMLLGFDAGLARGRFTKTQKTADLITELGHRFEIR